MLHVQIYKLLGFSCLDSAEWFISEEVKEIPFNRCNDGKGLTVGLI